MSPTSAGAVPSGLSEPEAAARRARGLGNAPPPPSGRTYAQVLRQNVFTFVNGVIFLLGLALVLVGRPTDALLSVGIVTTNVVVSVVQEVRAKRILDRIALLTRPTANLVRGGRERIADPAELVIGDAVRVGTGDQVLLDGTVAAGRMQVDQSQLTGESDPVPVAPGDPVYSGSFCVTGAAYVTVEKAGSASLANRITVGARAHRRVLTPLQKEINLTLRVILSVVIYLELLLVANGLINALPLPDGVEQATVIAGLVPNGLFLSIAVAYALGAVRIARRGALIQQANAVESLSNVDVLCMDKTGTLTTNQLRFEAAHPLDFDAARLAAALGAMTASVTAPTPTGRAIAAAFPRGPLPLAAEAPFSSARRWSAVAFDGPELSRPEGAPDHAAPGGLYALGAPEVLRDRLAAGGAPWDAIAEQIERWTSRGLRVLLLAHHPDPRRLRVEGDEFGLPGDMRAAGLVCLRDELRPEAQETLERFRAAGVQLKIISGDHAETVAALARQVGFPADAPRFSGADLAGLDDDRFADAAADGVIFGRIDPQQKEQLVEALKGRGRYVAMIGDGVNDVLSLKKASLGIALQSGAQATRSVADIVLLADSFSSLAPAVSEGQRIVNGMQDILKLFLARIATMALTIPSAVFIGVFPIDLRHASLFTLLTVGIPAVMLAVWAHPGAREGESIARRLLHFVVPAALLSTVLGLIVFYSALLLRLAGTGLDVTHASPAAFRAAAAMGQTALTTFLVATGLLLVVFVEPPTRWWTGGDVYSGDRRPALLALALALGYAAVMAWPGARVFFDLRPLAAAELVLIAAAVAIWLVLVRWIWRARLLERFFDAL